MAKPGARNIKDYGIDLKPSAVQLSNQPGVLVKDVAEPLDIHPFMPSKCDSRISGSHDLSGPSQVESAKKKPWWKL